MSVKHIYFVRHGQTDDNRSWKHQSFSTPLNARGLEQARATASLLKEVPVDLFISSDATRTLETARVLRSVMTAPLTQDKIFREVHRPVCVLGARFWSVRSILYAMRLYMFSSANVWPYKDGENMRAVQARAKRALALLMHINKDHIVVVSHRLFISAILAEILGKDVTRAFSHFWTIRSLHGIANGSITELLYDQHSKTPWTILRGNDISPKSRAVA